MRVSDIRIGYRLLAVVIVGALGLTGFAFVSLSNLHDALGAEREAKTKEHVEVAANLIKGIARNAAKTGRPVAEAQRLALDALQAVRYAGDQYYWVNDMSGEAASAGEAGRRFGVVAAEIRRLADNVTQSTGEIESQLHAAANS